MSLSFGERVKIILKRRNMTVSQLADALGTSRQNLSNNFQEITSRKKKCYKSVKS